MSTQACTFGAVGLAVALATGATTARAEQTEPLPMEPLFQLNPTDPADLAEQTRVFPTSDRDAVLLAAAATLQDMGYEVTGGQKQFGLLMGEKRADVAGAGAAHALGEAALVTATVLLSLLIGEDVVTDLPSRSPRSFMSACWSANPGGTAARGRRSASASTGT